MPSKKPYLLEFDVGRTYTKLKSGLFDGNYLIDYDNGSLENINSCIEVYFYINEEGIRVSSTLTKDQHFYPFAHDITVPDAFSIKITFLDVHYLTFTYPSEGYLKLQIKNNGLIHRLEKGEFQVGATVKIDKTKYEKGINSVEEMRKADADFFPDYL